MASQNQLSRYGAISRIIPELAPSAKVFLVGDSDDTTYGVVNLANDFPADKDGIVRVYTTIQAAVNAAAGGRGDVVLVAPNHVELLNRADSWNVAGVQVIGMGNGDQRAGVRFDTATSEIGLGANGVRVSNLNFLASNDSIARAVDMDSGFFGQRIDHCLFNIDSGTDDFRVCIRAGAKESIIEDNQFIPSGDTTGSGKGIALLGGDADNTIIRNNYFYGQFDTVGDTSDGAAAIAQDTADTLDTNMSGLVIQNNVIVSTDTAVGAAIRFSAGFTNRGMLIGNSVYSYDSAGTDTVIVAVSGMGAIENYLRRSDTTQKLVGQDAIKITDSGN